MALQKIKVENDKITIFPLHQFYVLGLVLSIVFFVIGVGTFIMLETLPANPESHLLQNTFFMLAIVAPIFLITYVVSRKQIQINLQSGDVYKSSFFIRRKIVNLQDIESVELISKDSPWGITTYYALVPRLNKYGKGYKISMDYTAGSSKAEKLRTAFSGTVVEPVRERLIGSAETQKVKIEDLKYFNRMGEFYHVKARFKFLYFMMLILFVAVGVYFGRLGEDWVYFLIIPALLYIYTLSRRVYIDAYSKELVVKHFLIYDKKYPLRNFTEFAIVHNSRLPYAEGTAVYMKFAPNNTEKKVVLRDFPKNKSIDRFMDEAKSLMDEINR